MHRFTREQLAFLREIAPGHSTSEHTRAMNERFGLQLTSSQVRAAKKNHGIRSGYDGRFPKGNRPWNAGGHYAAGGRSAETRFKPGQLPHTWMPKGSERVNSDGYLDVKVEEPNKWRAKHRLIWEAAHGPIPKGHAIIFADGDKTNVQLDNLVLVSRGQLVVMNKQGLIYDDAESTKTGAVIADVLLSARRRKKGIDETKQEQ